MKAIVKITTLCLLGMLMLTSCQRPAEYRTVQGATWGTTYHITYNSNRDLSDSIVAVMAQIDQSLSPFVSESLVSRVNRCDSTVCADAMLRQVVDLSQYVCRLSGGMFDPTVAPLVNLWGFGYRQANGEPTADEIAAALQSVGILECSIDDEGRIVKKTPEMEMNFSAIAKGYGVDKIAEMLRRNGCQDYMVEVGGEIALSGSNPGGEQWRIQVDAPVEDPDDEVLHERLRVLSLTDRCVATSGNYRNYRKTATGERIGHTISPLNGYPVSTTTLSATILAPTTALADALATASMALPDSVAVAMLQSQPGVGYLLVVATDSAYQIISNID